MKEETALTKEYQVTSELDYLDEIVNKLTENMHILEKRLQPILRQEDNADDAPEEAQPSRVQIAGRIADTRSLLVNRNNQVSDILNRLEV